MITAKDDVTKQAVEHQRDEKGNPAVLAEMIKDGSIIGCWEASSDLQGPTEIKESELTDRNVSDVIVDEVKVEDRQATHEK